MITSTRPPTFTLQAAGSYTCIIKSLSLPAGAFSCIFDTQQLHQTQYGPYLSRSKKASSRRSDGEHTRSESAEARARAKEAGAENNNQTEGSSKAQSGQEEMKEMRPITWLIILGACALGLLVISYMNPGSSNKSQVMSNRQVKQANKDLGKLRERGKTDTVNSQKLVEKGARTEAGIQAMRKQAVVLHKKSVSHASPVPTSDTAIARLQGFFSTYGDKPARAAKANLH